MSWGILVRYFGEAVDHHTLDFVKEFGLILFVFTHRTSGPSRPDWSAAAAGREINHARGRQS